MSDEQAGSERRRIEALEVVVRSLVASVEGLRRDLARLSGAPSATSAPATRAPEPSREVPPTPPASGDLEQLAGRYGTLVVAMLVVLLGFGTFLQWAIARGMLGPEVRVGLGALAAVLLTALGLWMRAKRSTKYGNALIVIALAIVHLDAWAAGPALGIVSPTLALTVAAMASLGLAALALREGEELLFCLGVGGALLAPFVTSTGEGSAVQLLAFGALVLSGAIGALRDADWRVARNIVPVFATWYVLAGTAALTRDELPSGRSVVPAAFALVLALVAVTIGARGVRRGLVVSLLSLVALAVLLGGLDTDTTSWTAIAYAFFGALTAQALRRRSTATADGGPDTWYEVVGLPLLLLCAAVSTEDRYLVPAGASVAAVWAGLTAAFVFLDGTAHRARHLAVILTAAVVAAVGLFHDREVARVSAFALVAVVSVLTLDRLRGAALLRPVGLSLLLGTGYAVELFDRRVAFEYTPFLNEASLAAATVVAAFVLMSWLAPRALVAAEEKRGPWSSDASLMAMRAVGPLVAFLWARAELFEAYSPDIATFSLVTYYALAGVGTILVGRVRAASAVRQAGLVLSLYAAVKVVLEASNVDRVGLRVGSYLVVGAFLLGVGYLYRAGVPAKASTA